MSIENSDGFSVNLSLDTASIVLPETFVVLAELNYPTGYAPDLEIIQEHLLQQQGTGMAFPFELIDVQQEKHVSEDLKKVTEKIKYKLEPLLPGKYAISLFNVPFHSENSVSPTIEIISNIVYVTSVQPKLPPINLKTELAPILDLSLREPIELNKNLREHLEIDHSSSFERLFEQNTHSLEVFFVLTALIGMVFGLKSLLKRKRIASPIIRDEVLPIQKAEQQLNALKTQEHLQKDTVEAFINNLSDSVRRHFERQFKVRVSTQTLEEFLLEMERHSEVTQRELIRDFLQMVDRIKFAKYQPNLDECIQVYAKAQKIQEIGVK